MSLSLQLQEAGNALRVSGVSTPNTEPALEPLLTAMSPDPALHLDENTSLLIITEACLGIRYYTPFGVLFSYNKPDLPRSKLLAPKGS